MFRWDKYGHVGIYSEGNKIIHTGLNRKELGVRKSPLQDITDVLDSYNKDKNQQTSYLGWAYPPKHWLKKF